MNPWVIPVGAAAVPLISCVAVCLFLLYRSHAVADDAGRRTAAVRTELEQRLEAIAGQVDEIRQEPPPIAAPSPPLKPGVNLCKRSQALRMHRRGDPPEQIAAALDVPYQEIELLLKVHRIVLSNI